MASPSDALEHVARSDAPHRAQLVRTIAQLLSSDVAVGEIWDRCAPLMAELAGGSSVTVTLREPAGDRIAYPTGSDAPLEPPLAHDVAKRVLDGGETITEIVAERATLGVPITFGRDVIGTVVAGDIALPDLEHAPLLESCALYAGARLHHETTLETTQRYQRLALVDGLTGIANRRKFDDTYPREWSRAARDATSITLLMMDVDYFKAFNDTYGHQAGDLCLQQVARALSDCLQRPADLLARYGGEEFVALLPATDLDGARFFAEKMRAKVAELAIAHAGSSLGRVTLSIGAVAEIPRSGRAPEALLHDADDALYRAKEAGRNRVSAGGYLSPGPAAERVVAGAPTNLPLTTTKMIGRRDEIATVERMAGENRLVTVLGAGGTGKTRVALHVAEETGQQYADGTWLVDLSSIRDGVLVPGAIGALFGAVIPADETGPDALARALQSKHVLIVLDNCEHVVDGAASCVSALLHACPSLRVIATSREPLSVSGEAVYRLPLLSLPDDDVAIHADRAAESDAVALFVERARAGRRTFALTDENAGRIAAIVRRLDGMALAIELAAARLSTMGLDALAARLDERFRILATTERDAHPRHKTVRATLDWSFELLEPSEQRLFRRLAIFAGPFTLDAVTEVCMGDGIDVAEIMDLLSGLVRKSLVVDDSGGLDDRYALLESMREYALERLIASGEDQRLAARHAAYFTQRAEDAVEQQYTMAPREWIATAERNINNDRAALEWTIGQRRDVTLGARLAAAAALLLNDASPTECLRWIDDAIAALAPGTSPSLEALLWLRKSSTTRNQAAPALRHAAERAVELYRKLDDPTGLSTALRTLAQILGWYFREERELADTLALEAIALARTTENPIVIADALKTRGLTIDISDFAAKRAVLEESLALFRMYGNDRLIGNVLTWISEMEFSAGEERRALDYGRDAVRFAEAAGGKALPEVALINLATYASAIGEWPTAQRAATEGLRISVETRSIAFITWAIQALAIVKIAHGNPRSGARLLGFCDARAGTIHVPRQADQSDAIAYARALARLQSMLSDGELAEEFARGSQYDEETAVIEARAT